MIARLSALVMPASLVVLASAGGTTNALPARMRTAAASALFVTLLVLATRRWHVRRAAHRPGVLHEDCQVSECAADGTPLSLYAG